MPAALAIRVQRLARRKRASTSKVLVELVEQGLNTQDREREIFLSLAERLVLAKDPREQRILKEQLAMMTFGA